MRPTRCSGSTLVPDATATRSGGANRAESIHKYMILVNELYVAVAARRAL